jgi:hypothetical protein
MLHFSKIFKTAIDAVRIDVFSFIVNLTLVIVFFATFIVT